MDQGRERKVLLLLHVLCQVGTAGKLHLGILCNTYKYHV